MRGNKREDKRGVDSVSEEERGREEAPKESVSVRGARLLRASQLSRDELLGRLLDALGDGSGLLEKESWSDFSKGLSPGLPGVAERSKASSKRRALDNYLGVMGWGLVESHEWEVGRLALLRCKVLDTAPEEAADAALSGIFNGLLSGLRFERCDRPEELARELFRSEAWANMARRGQRGPVGFFCATLDELTEQAISEEEEERSPMWRAVIEELLSSAEERPELRVGPRGEGEALLRLARFVPDYADTGGEEICALVGKTARRWIEAKIDWPAEGEMAALACEAIKSAAAIYSERVAGEAALTLKTALDCGMGARRASGRQPLKILMEAQSSSMMDPKSVEKAGQALLDAGASSEDLRDPLEELLAKAPNKGLARMLRARMERQAILDGLGGLSAEEAELIQALRKAKAERPMGEAKDRSEPRRRAGL